jgi:hypothetical protein
VIQLRLSGHVIIHSVEGQIYYIKNPILEGEEWK